MGGFGSVSLLLFATVGMTWSDFWRRSAEGAVLFAVFVVASMVVFIPGVRAATGAFRMDLDVNGPVVVVTVRFLQPVTAVGQFERSGVLGRLIGALPADEVNDKGRPLPGSQPVPVILERVEGGRVYEGQIEVGDGEWAFFPWPATSGFDPDRHPGAPPTAFVTVGGVPPVLWLTALAAALVSLVGASALKRGRSVPVAPDRLLRSAE